MTRLAFVSLLAVCASAALAAPYYTIHDLGPVSGFSSAQGLGVSPNGIATGRQFGTGTRAFTWTLQTGVVVLNSLTTPARNFCSGNDVNRQGQVVGVGATTFFGSSRLPLIWNGTSVSQLALPAGETIGDAYAINDTEMVAGSVDGGSLQQAAFWSAGVPTVITATTSSGEFMVNGYGVNNAGYVVGSGWDPNNAARTVGLIYNTHLGVMESIGFLAALGHNSAIAFDISDGGHVTGSSSLNGGVNSRAFVWTSGGGMIEVPLPSGASSAIGRAVNSDGWVVGEGSGAFSRPFLFDGADTALLQDRLINAPGWDISTNTSASAQGITDDGMIVGTGVVGGVVKAYAMTPVVVTGTLSIEGYGGSMNGVQADVTVMDGNSTLESLTVTLGAGGSFRVVPGVTGNVTLKFSALAGLRRAVAVNLGAGSSLNNTVSLINGDIDQDNEVGPGDFGALATAFLSVDGDPNWNLLADLDGDGEVGPGDFGILATNFLTSGD